MTLETSPITTAAMTDEVPAPPPPPPPLARFLAWLDGRAASPHTRRAYEGDLRGFAAWYLTRTGEGWEGVPNATPLCLAQYVRELTLEGLAPASIRRKLTVVGKFLRFAHDRGMRLAPVPELPRLPSSQNSAPRWLPTESRTVCLRAAGRVGSEETQALVTFLLHTGLRASEACGLCFGDIDAGRYEGALRVRGKGNKERFVPLNATARAALKDLGWTKGSTPERPLLASQRGERLTPSGLLRRIRTVGKAAGLRVTPHTLRHTYLKSLIDAGVPLHVAAVLAGHSSLQTTAAYTKPGTDDLFRAVMKLKENPES